MTTLERILLDAKHASLEHEDEHSSVFVSGYQSGFFEGSKTERNKTLKEVIEMVRVVWRGHELDTKEGKDSLINLINSLKV